MSDSRAFPADLLLQPIAERLHYFNHKVIAHPRLVEAYEALRHAIRYPSGASLIFVFGPTGVGKTTLRLRIEKYLIESALSDSEKDPGYIPVAGIEAVAPEAGSFNWKDYYRRALVALDEPMIEYKLDLCTPAPVTGFNGIRRDSQGKLIFEPGAVASELRRSLEFGLRYRKPMAFFIDEAQHLKKLAGGRQLMDQLDTIKSLANITGSLHVLVGTYEMLNFTNLSAQLSRRSVDIHFPRYRPDDAQDLATFESVVLTFQKHLPLEDEPDLVSHCAYLYDHSVGCIGVLKNWVNRTLAATLENGQTTITLSDLEKHAEPTRKLLRMAREIREGEESLRQMDGQDSELRELLGAEAPKAQSGQTRRPNTQVGERRPIRDTVGSL